MENASKALIIAGAILLAILIISLGIMIYNQASGVMDSGAMDEVAVTTFNEKFMQYTGDKIRGAQVNALIDAVRQNNISNSDDSSKQITIKGDSLSDTNWSGTAPSSTGIKVDGTTNGQIGKALTGKTYAVTYSNNSNGYISEITIKAN